MHRFFTIFLNFWTVLWAKLILYLFFVKLVPDHVTPMKCYVGNEVCNNKNLQLEHNHDIKRTRWVGRNKCGDTMIT